MASLKASAASMLEHVIRLYDAGYVDEDGMVISIDLYETLRSCGADVSPYMDAILQMQDDIDDLEEDEDEEDDKDEEDEDCTSLEEIASSASSASVYDDYTDNSFGRLNYGRRGLSE